MSLKGIELSSNEQAFRPIGEWAKVLSIPQQILLYHASRDDLPLFARPAQSNVAFYSVHEAFAEAAPSEIPDWAQPVSMPEPGVVGVFLRPADYVALASGLKIKQSLFPCLLRSQAGWTNFIFPIPRTLTPGVESPWRIVMLDRSTALPVHLKLTPSTFYARDVDVASFIERLKSYEFISDLFSNGLIDLDLPVYVSHKLREVIESNAICWRGYPDIDLKEVPRRRQNLQEILSDEFLAHCDKKTEPGSLLKFAAEIADPHLLHPSRQLASTSVTPAILGLLTVAKLFWSAYSSGIHCPETYPKRESIVAFLRALGLGNENQASSGATLIRPESAQPPVKTLVLRPTKFQRRQAI